MPVDPRGEDLKRYIKQDPGGPVVMLNLLKYRAGGEQSYRAYSAALKDYLPSIGAEVLYVGDCSTALVAPAGWDWDAVLIVRYPSRQVFSAMVYSRSGKVVGRIRGKKVYGTDGLYVGTITGGRLVHRSTESAGVGSSFSVAHRADC